MKRRGLSLAETLLCLFLLGLVISVAADLAFRARKVMLVARQESELEDVAFALQRLAMQATGANRILQPGLNSSSDRLQFQRVRAALPNRLPTTLGATPAPVPPSWDPLEAAYQEIVLAYQIDGTGLVLDSPSDGEVRLCAKIKDFQCLSAGHLLTLKASLGQRLLTSRQWLAPGVQW